MTNANVFTFAIPFYGNDDAAFSYLEATIKSVVAQSSANWTAFVMDDASPRRGAEEIVNRIGDKRISYVRSDVNRGQSGNWNECVKRVSTPYFTLLHADDLLKPDYLQTMLAAIERNPEAAAVFCNAEIIDENGEIRFSTVDYVKKILFPLSREFSMQGDSGLALMMKGNMIMCPTVCYRKSRMETYVFSPDWRAIPDFYYWTKLLLNDALIIGVPNVAFQYRRHGGSGTAAERRALRMFEEESRLYDLVSAAAKAKNWTSSARAAERKRMLKLRTMYFAVHDVAALRPRAALDKFRLLLSF